MPVDLWHTFNREETAILNQVIARVERQHPRWHIRSTVIPFGQAQNAFRRAAGRCGPEAPDIFRAELPWIPEFVSRRLLRPVPTKTRDEAELLPAARDAARYVDMRWALPANVDCLALLYNRELVAEPPQTFDRLVQLARQATVDRAGRHPDDPRFDAEQVRRWGFFVRADGYWFLPFLWANGGRLLDPSAKKIFIAEPPAVAALERYAGLIHRDRVAPPRPSPSSDYEDQMRRFGRGELAMILNGPWATAAILASPAFRGHPDRLGVAPFPEGSSDRPSAPLSGHGFVVSRCSKRPAVAWRLAAALSDAAAQERFARRARLLPANKAVYARPAIANDRLLAGFRRALAGARARPRHPAMSRIFDDLNPAVQAVVLGEARADEALEAVAVAWARLLEE